MSDSYPPFCSHTGFTQLIHCFTSKCYDCAMWTASSPEDLLTFTQFCAFQCFLCEYFYSPFLAFYAASDIYLQSLTFHFYVDKLLWHEFRGCLQYPCKKDCFSAIMQRRGIDILMAVLFWLSIKRFSISCLGDLFWSKQFHIFGNRKCQPSCFILIFIKDRFHSIPRQLPSILIPYFASNKGNILDIIL